MMDGNHVKEWDIKEYGPFREASARRTSGVEKNGGSVVPKTRFITLYGYEEDHLTRPLLVLWCQRELRSHPQKLVERKNVE